LRKIPVVIEMIENPTAKTEKKRSLRRSSWT